MTPLQFLRQSKHIARWVLVWFALSITAAVAAPVIKPQGLALVCTAAGQVKMVSTSNTGSPAADVAVSGTQGGADAAGLHQQLDCVLCLTLNVPPVPDVRLPLAASLAVEKPARASNPFVPQLRALTLSARGPPATAGYALFI